MHSECWREEQIIYLAGFLHKKKIFIGSSLAYLESRKEY